MYWKYDILNGWAQYSSPANYKSVAKEFVNKLNIRVNSSEFNSIVESFKRKTLDYDTAHTLAGKILLKNLPRFATGGFIKLQNGGKLPGYGGGDRNLALLEDGEFVIRKEAVKAFGVDLFSALNSLKLPKFQTGGIVGSASNVSYNAPEMNVNLNIGNKSFKMQTDEMTAKALESYLRKML